MQLYGTYRCHYPAGYRPGPQAVRTQPPSDGSAGPLHRVLVWVPGCLMAAAMFGWLLGPAGWESAAGVVTLVGWSGMLLLAALGPFLPAAEVEPRGSGVAGAAAYDGGLGGWATWRDDFGSDAGG